MIKDFKNWALLREFKDVFGFDKELIVEPQEDKQEPVNSVNIDYITNQLSERSIGNKQGFLKFINEVRWGYGYNGDLRIVITPTYKIIVEQLATDLYGEPQWIAKKVIQIDRQGSHGGDEDIVVEELSNELDKLNSNLDSPKNNWDGVEHLVSALADNYKKIMSNIFIFEGVRQINQNEYIIRLNVRGQGVEAPDQRRVLENQTHIFYDNKGGYVKIYNYNIESPTGDAPSWQIMPSDLSLYFFPTQSIDEIVKCVSNLIHFY